MRGSFWFPGLARKPPGCAEDAPSYHRGVQNDYTAVEWNRWPATVSKLRAAVTGAHEFAQKTTDHGTKGYRTVELLGWLS